MRYRMLGPVRVSDEDGHDRPLSGAKQRLLLAVLLSQPNEPVPAPRLVEALWGVDPPQDPRAALQSQVSRLRRQLAPAALDLSGTSYCLAVAPGELDSGEFARLLDAAGDDAPAARLQQVEAALALWRGPAFGDLADHPALRGGAERLEDRRASAREARAQLLLDLGRHEEARAEAAALVEEHPLREAPRTVLMRALYAAGRHVESLQVYEDLRRRLAQELGLDPSPALRVLHAQILRHELAPPSGAERLPAPRAHGGDLPSPVTSFVDRSVDLTAVARGLERTRILTLTGPAGVGKTRLAAEVAAGVARRYPDGTWFCDLSAGADEADVLGLVASCLRVQRRVDQSALERLSDFLATQRALLVLDHCDGVRPAAARLAEHLVERTAGADVLATSREPLGAAGERVRPVQPLPVPGKADVLFLDRGRALRADFALDDPGRRAVARLCRRLDGLPLAIELAAAGTAAAAPGEIADALAERAVAGGDERRDVREDQRPTRARRVAVGTVVEWSYDRLGAAERDMLARLSVFEGGFTADSARAVLGAGHREGPGELVDALAEKSLVSARRATEGVPRYELLPTVKGFARDRLEASGQAREVGDRHAAYFSGLAQEADAGLRGPDEPRWVRCLDTELANLRAAHRWLLGRGWLDTALLLVVSLFWYAWGGTRADVFSWAEATIDRNGDLDHALLSPALALAGLGAWRRGDLAGCERLAHEAVGVARRLGHPPAARHASSILGDHAAATGHPDEAARCFADAARLAQQVGDGMQAVVGLGGGAIASACARDHAASARLAGEALDAAAEAGGLSAQAWAGYAAGEVRLETAPALASQQLERSLELATAAGNAYIAGLAGLSATAVAARTGDAGVALSRIPGLLEHWRRSGERSRQWTTIRLLVDTLIRLGHDEPAAILTGAVLASPTAPPLQGGDAERLAWSVATLGSRLGIGGYERLAWNGAAYDDEEVVVFAARTAAGIADVSARVPAEPVGLRLDGA